MPYTEATVHEVLRVSSVAPLGLPHEAAKDITTSKGVVIPKGTTIFPNLWAILR